MMIFLLFGINKAARPPWPSSGLCFFKEKFKNRNIGGVIMEVERNEKPKYKFLKEIRRLTLERNIPLIFDECTSGFRETRTGIFEKYKIYPDLAMFGKSIANGHAFSLIAGKKDIMNTSKKTFLGLVFLNFEV